MLTRLLSYLKAANPATRAERKPRRLQVQPLESRAMMTAVPALSSLPDAPHSLYLDFNGHFQATWNRTDSGQTYRNVSVGEFNLDNTAGFSTGELTAINKIFQTVAEDYAPFNINVTTVLPASFANGAATRVVMCGNTSAQLVTGTNTTVSVSGDRFITDDGGATLVDTSGYAAVNSYSNAEPNVVFVFAKYISTWGTIDSEGQSRDLQYVMATTASHEAGHSFGLVHHGDYDVGSNITTPIMGSNTQGDRSLWSQYGTHDNLQELTTLLGARADDFASSYGGAGTFQLTSYSPIRGSYGNVAGVISRAGDSDWFRLNSTGGRYNFSVQTRQFANLDSRLEVYRIYDYGVFTIKQLVGAADPGINFVHPFIGLGASLKLDLAAGTYAVVVRSHGGYGDLGNYTLGISKPTIFDFNPDPVLVLASTSTSSTSSTSTTTVPTTTFSKTDSTLLLSAGAGQQQTSSVPLKKRQDVAADELFAKW